ncbi:hypothetical protein [Bacillus sp. MB353a]|uniref:hypothetical protein n=1 Tax=Bacillus sp. MB353a TaxID=1982041 RepID=UPI003F8D8392
MRKNAAGVVIHNDIKNSPFLNIPMIINEKNGMIYEVRSAVFYTNDAVATITRDVFATTRVNVPIVSIKSIDSSIQGHVRYSIILCIRTINHLFKRKIALIFSAILYPAEI